MSPNNLIYGLWLGGIGLEGLLLVTLWSKKAWIKFPLFSAYSAFIFIGAGGLYFLRSHHLAYFWSYWVCEAVGLILGLGVVYEIFHTLFRGHIALRRLATRAFRWIVAGLIFLAITIICFHDSGPRAGLLTASWVIEEGVRIIEVGLVVSLFVLSSAFGLHWRQSVFGIAVGLGIFASVELAAVAMRVQLGFSAMPTFNVVRGLAFNTSLLVWIGYMLAPERVTTAELPKTAQLEQWNQAIMELIHQ